MLARCLVPLPLPPTPSPLSWLLFRLHHLLSYPYQACTSPRRNLSSSHSGIVVSLSLSSSSSPPHRERRRATVCSSSFSSPITFSSFSSSSSGPASNARSPSFSPLSSGFYFIPTRAPITRLCSFTVATVFSSSARRPRRLHRSPLFLRHPLRIPPLLLLLVSSPRDALPSE